MEGHIIFDGSGEFKQFYGGLQVVSLGKPFRARISIAAEIELAPGTRKRFKTATGDYAYRGVYVPFEIRLKDGTIKKWQLAIRCDNSEHRWYGDGGL